MTDLQKDELRDEGRKKSAVWDENFSDDALAESTASTSEVSTAVRVAGTVMRCQATSGKRRQRI